MLRFLANENFPGDAVKALTRIDCDVAWILKDAPGSSDEEVLKKAMEEERILITFDKDFGELAFKRGLPASCGIILFRIPLLSPQYVVKIVEEALKSRNDWAGYFSVVEMSRSPDFRLYGSKSVFNVDKPIILFYILPGGKEMNPKLEKQMAKMVDAVQPYCDEHIIAATKPGSVRANVSMFEIPKPGFSPIR